MLGLLSLLKLANVDPTALRVCIQSAALTEQRVDDGTAVQVIETSVYDSDSAILRGKIKQVFEAVFALTPEITPVLFNRDAPMAYLRWDSGANAGRAAGTTAGLSAYMICIRAYLIYKESLECH